MTTCERIISRSLPPPGKPQTNQSSANPNLLPALAVLYANINYGGAEKAFYASYPCSTQAHAVYYVGDDFNDVASSGLANVSEGCNGGFRFYKNLNLQPAPPSLCSAYCSWVGAINDQISSFIVY